MLLLVCYLICGIWILITDLTYIGCAIWINMRPLYSSLTNPVYFDIPTSFLSPSIPSLFFPPFPFLFFPFLSFSFFAFPTFPFSSLSYHFFPFPILSLPTLSFPSFPYLPSFLLWYLNYRFALYYAVASYTFYWLQLLHLTDLNAYYLFPIFVFFFIFSVTLPRFILLIFHLWSS